MSVPLSREPSPTKGIGRVSGDQATAGHRPCWSGELFRRKKYFRRDIIPHLSTSSPSPAVLRWPEIL
ncbi:hypothetical protein Hanom_Chr08g00727651 [Helianthus anomalus]